MLLPRAAVPTNVVAVGLPDDEPAQHVLGAVGTSLGVILPALDRHLLRGIEEVPVHERRMGGGMPILTEEDLADLGAVAKDCQYRAEAPGLAADGPMAALGEPVRDGSGALRFMPLMMRSMYPGQLVEVEAIAIT